MQTSDLDAARRTDPATSLVSADQVMEELNISAPTMWRWRKKGLFGDDINIYGRIYLSRNAVKDFVERAKAGKFRRPPRGAAAKRQRTSPLRNER